MAVMLSMVTLLGAAEAQVAIDATVGYLIPNGDFSDTSDPGFGIGADAFVGLPFIPLEVGGRVSYNRFGASDDFKDGNSSFIEILPSVRYIFGPPLSPLKFFGQFGVGMYNWSNEFELKNIKTKLKDDGTDFGFAVGAGVRGKLGPLPGIIAMPMYHVIMTEDENTTYISLNLGVAF